MPIVVGGSVTPLLPPPTRPAQRQGLRSIWTGWDGTVIDLNDDTSGICLQEGVRGLAMPPVTHYRSEAPAVAGSRYRGTRAAQRDVFWPVRVWHPEGQPADYISLDRLFWRTLDPTRTGTWTVYSPTGDARSLDLRYESDDGTWDYDPVLRGWNLYGITLIAEQPYWRGQAVTRTFTNDPPVPFFGPPGLFNISSGSDVASAKITNPGDVPGWVTWTIRGPVDGGSSVGFAGAQIPIIADVADGETLVIYTQPDLMIALLDGVEVELDATSKFRAVPAGGTTSLLITLAAADPGGSIEGSLATYFYRAF